MIELRTGARSRSLALFALGLAVVGCTAEQRDRDDGQRPAAVAASGPPTFAADVAPIIYDNCSVCHHDGGAGPFTLRSYDDVSDHAQQIVEVTASGYMPPWLPREGYGNFVGQRHLSAAHKQVLADWVAGGRLPGDLSRTPSFPSFATGWELGAPDLELRADAAYELPAAGKDIYRNFVIPVPPGPTRFVRTVELAPGSPKVVHHAVMRLDVEGEARRLDAADPEPGFDGMVFGGATMPGGHFIGWTPGRTADPGSDERSWQLTGGTDIVVQVHLRPTGKPELIQPKLGLHFAPGPPTKPALAMVLSSTAIDIDPGDSDFRVNDTFVLPVDVRVLSVYPHAHYVGKQLEGFATLPDGSRQWLVKIDDWDFNWQDQYRYQHPIALPKGTVITMDHRYDNSAQNPRNPFSPPQRIVFGANSTDEMAELILEVEPVNPAELGVLDEASRQAWLSVQIQTIARALAKQPDDPELHANLAAMLSHAGRHTEARKHYEAALAQRDDANTRVELAIVLAALDQVEAAELELDAALRLEPAHARAHLVRGNHQRLAEQFAAAVASYERAVAADPELVEAHNNLGVAYEKLDQPARAATAFARAAQLSPGRALFWENLGRASEAAQQYDEALAAYRTALNCNMNSFKAMRGLAWLLATHADPSKRNPTQALALAEAAGRATGFRSPEVLEALAASLAAAGRFEPATEAIGRAIELAQVAKRPDLEARYQAHAALIAKRQGIVLGP